MKLHSFLEKKPSHKKQILIVDSEWNILKLLYSFLSHEFVVIAKNNPVDAFHWLLNNNEPAVIITELKLAGFDGLSFLKHLKYSGLYKDIPVILLSDQTEENIKGTDLSIFADAVLIKPFNPSYLIYKINLLINEQESSMA